MTEIKVPDIYELVPLSPETGRCIRLLEVVDIDDGDGQKNHITCTLQSASLNETYAALSYMWGEECPFAAIEVNGRLFNIRQNLHDFLTQVRLDQIMRTLNPSHRYQRAGPKLFWIDALCINQEDVPEKNQQVALMGKIFSKAVKVVAWLGKEDELVCQAMDFFKNFEYTYHPRNGATSLDFGVDTIPWSALQICLDTRYWRRAWIVQECILAKDLEVCGGSKSVPAERIMLCWTVLTSEIDVLVSCKAEMERLSESSGLQLLLQRQRWRRSRTTYLQPWEEPVRECSDVRDRLFAMISLMDPALGIVADYGQSVDDLLWKLKKEGLPHVYHPLGIDRSIQGLARLLKLSHKEA